MATRRNVLRLKKPIVLVGLMGAGKSTVGRRLARSLGLDFKDSDEEIVEAAGCSISDIFEIHGESIFRDVELRVIKRLLDEPPSIIATGGGAFIQPAVRKAVRDKGVSIWLRADLDVLVDRVSRRNTRPLLETGNKREIMGKLMDERYPTYEEADLVIDSAEGSHEVVVAATIRQLKAYIKQKHHEPRQSRS